MNPLRFNCCSIGLAIKGNQRIAVLSQGVVEKSPTTEILWLIDHVIRGFYHSACTAGPGRSIAKRLDTSHLRRFGINSGLHKQRLHSRRAVVVLFRFAKRRILRSHAAGTILVMLLPVIVALRAIPPAVAYSSSSATRTRRCRASALKLSRWQ
jgi:hypothetical protein